MKTARSTRITTARALGILTLIYAATFFVGSMAHLGSEIPLGFAILDEPRIIPATIVEGLCGAALLVGAYAMFARKEWVWQGAVAGHIVALGGVLLGIMAQTAGGGERSMVNDIYHAVILVALVVNLGLLFTTRVKAALGYDSRAALSSN